MTLGYRGVSDEIDVDATLEAIVENPLAESSSVKVRERVRTRRSVVIAVDISGSMRGERIRVLAAGVGALSSQLSRDDVAVVAFWSDAVVVKEFGESRSLTEILDALLRLPTSGLTNLSFPLQVAARLLSGCDPQSSRLIVMSDCLHNAGPDPRTAAGTLARLDVMLDVSGEHDTDMARDLASAGHGVFALVRGLRDVVSATRRIFAT